MHTVQLSSISTLVSDTVSLIAVALALGCTTPTLRCLAAGVALTRRRHQLLRREWRPVYSHTNISAPSASCLSMTNSHALYEVDPALRRQRHSAADRSAKLTGYIALAQSTTLSPSVASWTRGCVASSSTVWRLKYCPAAPSAPTHAWPTHQQHYAARRRGFPRPRTRRA